MGAAPPPDAMAVDRTDEGDVYLGTVRTRSGDLVRTVDESGNEPLTLSILVPQGFRALDPVEFTVSEVEETVALLQKAVEVSKRVAVGDG